MSCASQPGAPLPPPELYALGVPYEGCLGPLCGRLTVWAICWAQLVPSLGGCQALPACLPLAAGAEVGHPGAWG